LGLNTPRLHTSHDDLAFKSFKKEELETLVQSIEAGRSAPAPVAITPEAPTHWTCFASWVN